MSQNVNQHLNGILADGIVLYQKLHHYHWRVKGEGFFQLHAKFEALYGHFAAVNDEVAERLLMVGGEPVASLKQALGAARIAEDESVPSGRGMVENLAADLEAYRGAVLAGIEAAEAAGDRGSANLLDPVADALDKELWMLRSFLEA